MKTKTKKGINRYAPYSCATASDLTAEPIRAVNQLHGKVRYVDVLTLWQASRKPTTEGVTANRGSRARYLKDGIGVDADTAKALPKRTRVLMLDLAT